MTQSKTRFNAHHKLLIVTFSKEKTFNCKEYANNVIILATTRLLVSERAGLLEQKIDPRNVTSGNSNFAQ